MASRKSLRSYESACSRPSQIRSAIRGVVGVPHRRGRIGPRCLEPMEGRVLLSAYSMSDVAYFGTNGSGAGPNSALIVDSSGNLYGTTAQGGAYGLGTVFEIPNGSPTVTALASFSGANGSNPTGVAMDASGNLYGTTKGGGTSSDGTLFEFATGSHAITTLTTFNGTNGRLPQAQVVIDASGNLFGTTEYGPASNYGTVFEMPSGSTTITTLVTFAGSNGAYGNGLTLDASGNLFGTATSTVVGNFGTVFEIPKNFKVITTLASFNRTNGASPMGGVTLDSAGNLYGDTAQGGANNLGTVFEIAPGSNVVTTLASFNGTNGSNPQGGLTLDASGNLYGTTQNGGATYGTASAGNGTVFEVANGSNAITTLTSFATPADPMAGLTLGPAGNLYGTTEYLGTGGTGMVFEVTAGSNAVTPFASFDQNDGITPYSPLAIDAAGNLYGTTEHGGAFSVGTVYEIANGSSAVTVLAAFNGADGSQPLDGVTLDAAGNLFGTASYGGANASGTVFELAKGSGTLTALASFPKLTNPWGGITLDASGDLFGTTQNGGTYGQGMVFEVPAGTNTLNTYASFNGSNGTGPIGGVTFDRAGNLYGTTQNGGTTGQGTIFEIAGGSTTITTLASFNGTNGQNPRCRIVIDSSGNLYGGAIGGGPNGYGTVFELPKGSNTITDLGSLVGYGTEPSGVVLDPFGNLFGTILNGGTGDGSVFEIAKGSSTLTVLASFNGGNGNQPVSGVIVDASGNLYGTTDGGGPANDGVLFKLTANTGVTLAATSGSNPSDASQALTFTAIVSGGVPDWESVLLVDTSNDNAVVAGNLLQGGSATLTIPAGTLSAGTHRLVAAYRGDANFAACESAAYAQTILARPPALAGAPVINGDDPNGLFTAPDQPTPGVQRSMVEDIVYTFNEAVTIPDANAAFTVVGTGPHAGTAPSMLLATAVPGSNGTQWAVSLTGKADAVLASIANGEYSITINPAHVFAAADGTTAMTIGQTDTFYRLFGDINGDRVVNVSDEFQFSKAMNTYIPIFDANGDGTVNLADEFQASRAFSSGGYVGDGFVTSI
jgi:uncharacterized repeat protein (TIGR03803 family)